MSYRSAGSSGDHTAQSPAPSSTDVRVHQIACCIVTSAEAKEVPENGVMGSGGQSQLFPVSGSTVLGWLSSIVKLHLQAES